MNKKTNFQQSLLAIGMAFLILGMSWSFPQVKGEDKATDNSATIDNLLVFNEGGGQFFMGTSGKLLVVNDSGGSEKASFLELPYFGEYLLCKALKVKLHVLAHKRPIFQAITFLYPFHYFW
ncbi:hypothetical protein [Pararhodonellum marinum]|uniref:hypothetical protein n=1 Tax=Pararhodonellum marinum TaxID=2755358 RepID=UPI00188DEC1E|nr:hypothetical protein [Pararhodonellum marinum]